MGIHLQKVWGSGEEDDQSLVADPGAVETFERVLSDSSYQAVGRHAALLYLHCPACQPNSFYHGWREFCLWLMTNSINGDEESPRRTQDDYRGMVLHLIHGYLWHYEINQKYGFDIFWSIVGAFLRIEVGGEVNCINDDALLRIDGYTSSQMFERIRECLELNDIAEKSLRQALGSYSDETTGLEAALLQLQTQFIYTGKPKRVSAEVKAARHP